MKACKSYEIPYLQAIKTVVKVIVFVFHASEEGNLQIVILWNLISKFHAAAEYSSVEV